LKSKLHFERAIDELPQEEPRASGARLRAASQPGANEQQAPRYQRLRAVLTKYVSPVLVDSVLERALSQRKLTPPSVEGADFAELIADIMLGLRLFVAERKLPELMLELTEMVLADPPPAASRSQREPTAIDARGKSCPVPVVLTAQALRDMKAGASLTVQADDRAFPEDMRAWCRKAGHDLVSLESKPGYHEALIRKA
jgi:TusA-related sulfurtransferase